MVKKEENSRSIRITALTPCFEISSRIYWLCLSSAWAMTEHYLRAPNSPRSGPNTSAIVFRGNHWFAYFPPNKYWTEYLSTLYLKDLSLRMTPIILSGQTERKGDIRTGILEYLNFNVCIESFHFWQLLLNGGLVSSTGQFTNHLNHWQTPEICLIFILSFFIVRGEHPIYCVHCIPSAQPITTA